MNHEPILLPIVPLAAESPRESERRTAQDAVNDFLQLRGKPFPQTIEHTHSGKPFLLQSPDIHVSISHSNRMLALLCTMDGSLPGVDIERKGRAVRKIRHKYVNEVELAWLRHHSVQQQEDLLHLIWCAKEAAFKIFSPPDASLLHFTLAEWRADVDCKSGSDWILEYEWQGCMHNLRMYWRIEPTYYLVWAFYK